MGGIIRGGSHSLKPEKLTTRINAPYSATGGIITVVGADTVHTFNGSANLVITGTIPTLTYLIVAGAGGGGGDTTNGEGGGGGAGGDIKQGTTTNATGTLPVTVGAGGAPNTAGTASSFNGIVANGGGFGGFDTPRTSPATGGGGLGTTVAPFNVGANGFNGFKGGDGDGSWRGGGGASPAANGANGITSGNGAEGVASSISGAANIYGSGAGSGMASGTGDIGGTGGTNAGNGAARSSGIAGTAGTANTGAAGGGGAFGVGGGTGHPGGSGIVIIRYSTFI